MLEDENVDVISDHYYPKVPPMQSGRKHAMLFSTLLAEGLVVPCFKPCMKEGWVVPCVQAMPRPGWTMAR